MKAIVNNFELLRTKSIISILDGDKEFGDFAVPPETKKFKISLPYLSGPVLCEISTKFGLPVAYTWGGTNKSRWEYLDNLMKYCIVNNKFSDLLSFLFSKAQFTDLLSGNTPEVIEIAYNAIISGIIEQINGELYFGGHELTIINNQFLVRKIGQEIAISAPSIKTIDRSYIIGLSNRAMKDVVDGNYDSAITKARTLLEEVFCYVIEKKGEAPSEAGDIGKLYIQVKTLYNMDQSKDIDKRIKELLSGLQKIVISIGDMRNKASDSHGVGAKRFNIAEHHARLFVNSAMTMADFVLSVAEKQNQDK